MNDELKKQLRDAGYTGDFGLSEIIGRIGYENFNGLSTNPNRQEWRAVGKKEIKPPFYDIATFGSSPEEAVSRLYIELHKKL